MASVRQVASYIDARPSFVGRRLVQMAMLARAGVSVLPSVAIELDSVPSDEACARLAQEVAGHLALDATRRVAITCSRTGEERVVEAASLAAALAGAWSVSGGAFLLAEALPRESGAEHVIETSSCAASFTDLCARITSVAGEACSFRVLEADGTMFVRHVRGEGSNVRRKTLPIRRVATDSLDSAGFVQVARGVPASIGYAVGPVSLTPARGSAADANQVLFRQTVTRENRDEIATSAALVCPSAGITSHAALFARAMGKPCVVGLSDVTVDERRGVLLDRSGQPLALRDGDPCLVDGTGGGIYRAPSLDVSVPCSYDVPRRSAPALAGRLAVDVLDSARLPEPALDLPLFVREATPDILTKVRPAKSAFDVWIRFEQAAGQLAALTRALEAASLPQVVFVARSMREALEAEAGVRRTGARLGVMVESPAALEELGRVPPAIRAVCVGLGDLGQSYAGRGRESAGGATLGWDIAYTRDVTHALKAFQGEVLIAGNAPLLPTFFEAIDGIGNVLRAEVQTHLPMAAWVWGVARTPHDPFGPDERS